MSFRSAGLTASLALAANAFMVPSTMSMPDANVDGLDPVIAAHDDSARIVKVACPGCSFEGADGSKDVDNSMVGYLCSYRSNIHKTNKTTQVLSWSLAEDKQVLLLNGREFYSGKLASWTRSFPTVQVPSTVSVDDIRSRLDQVATSARDMSYRVFERFTHAADGTDAQLIDVDFSINSLGDERVYGADSLTLRILKDEAGRLAIADIVQVPADNTKPAHEDDESSEESEQAFNILPVGHPSPPTIPMGQKMDCSDNDTLCRAKAMMHHQMDILRNAMQTSGNKLRIFFIGHAPPHMAGGHERRPCKGKMAGQAGPPGMTLKGGVPKFWRLGHPAAEMDAPHHPMSHPHGHRRGGCRMGRFLRALRRVFVGFVLPVLVGVAAGLSASLLGMVVGTGLAMFWIRCVRGGRRGNASMRMEESRGEIALDGEEKAGLMEEEALPEYEDAPAYEAEATEVKH